MIAGPPVNADPDKVVVVNTTDMAWEPTDQPGVSRKVLERVEDARKGRETALVRFAPGTALAPETLEERLDVVVIEGDWSDGQASYGAQSFVRNPPGTRITQSSTGGCVLYVKRRVPIRKTDDERLAIDSKTATWIPFPHRGADVLHLYRDRHGIETSRIGVVHPEKRIPSHDHAMGEETLIIAGCLKDEHGVYSPGTWFRFPIGVPHAPYTEAENCLMLIREGDLVW